MLTMKKSLLATSILGLSISMAGMFTLHADEKAETDVVIATVNGDKIMKSTLDGYMEILKKSGKGDQEAAVNDLVATEIALQEAKKTDILERPETKKAISDFTRNILLKTWTKEKVESFDIKDEDIKAAYDERVTKLASKEFNARHILVKTEDEAKAVIKEVADGADFAKVAKEKSTGPSGSNGGSLGWFKAQTMVPAFANAVKEMSKGDVSKEPVKTQFGYHVIKLEDSRDAKLPTLESLKPQLTRVISQKQMLAYMENLKKDADIKLTLPEVEKAEAKTEEKAEEKKD
ncbi:peptidylprolyl isomerase [Cocleimonas flava]|jgi:peptidyl-prolyl cis-trans isomerase C|uniref:peptidylprolyl isomerase n=1 Tax=Cocleimonas flava TaxID=634765 RepID=A0A4R1F707_9GAMM|nr:MULTISPECIES: peptidylprolyl isomerase [Cocleimonas]MEB8433003.1 peptidylprolyl isomerase [Cocleimonas sp. KMM 6892]MEC4716016.1 peptidylprolyl isomerase [Cocleimonas sp. KMM 6895]MEC4745477.1 peptidylprolyl isomerase [Cocleimonas sp. KMM 6896]TCJ87748.1 peptidyl-prolyl cis-trans isomerase C [Cocleimonas flava]